ncbi:rCG23716 [Rattus norvegicus]|uniref:RCG23716 n=1 Tax=Rattus norvegicus TaxID=10116 RepID=A6JVS5_RAT|nr:rCG23716 [Rattus norvegicus]
MTATPPPGSPSTG